MSTSIIKKIATATPTFSIHHPDQSVAINVEARPFISKMVMALKAQIMVSIFLAMKYFFKVCMLVFLDTMLSHLNKL